MAVDADVAAVPVFVFTGFLGAGKTTLLNHLIKESGKRLAVIENEFGAEIGMEAGLVRKAPSGGAADDLKEVVEFREIVGGCVCCSVRPHLISALEEVALGDTKYDAVILETTGLANPQPVANVFEAPQLKPYFTLMGVVVVVDVGRVSTQLAAVKPPGVDNEARVQLALADVVVANKIDTLPDAAALDDVVSQVLGAVGRDVPVLRTEYSRVDAERMLSGRLFDVFNLEDTLKRHPDFLTATHHVHDDTIVSKAMTLARPVPQATLLDALKAVCAGGNILRMKGEAVCSDAPDVRLVIQGVGTAIQVHDTGTWADSLFSTAATRLVFIGRRLGTVEDDVKRRCGQVDEGGKQAAT